jgi:hypothetical protein
MNTTKTTAKSASDLFTAVRDLGYSNDLEVSCELKVMLSRFYAHRYELADLVTWIHHELLMYAQSVSVPEYVLEAAAIVFELARGSHGGTTGEEPVDSVATCAAHALRAAFLDNVSGPTRTRRLALATAWLDQVHLAYGTKGGAR